MQGRDGAPGALLGVGWHQVKASQCCVLMKMAPFPGVRRNWTCCTWKVARPGPLGPSHCPPDPSSVACGELHDLCGL